MTPEFNEYQSRNELDLSLSDHIVEALQVALDERGVASLVVSGGKSPRQFLVNLSEQDIDWSCVYVTLADERCVLDIHPDSNAKMIKDHLIQNLACEVNFVPLYIQGESQMNCQQRFINHRVLADIYDVVILGMGLDGHTASIFPQAIERDQALNMDTMLNVLLTNPVTTTPLRITQTRKRLLNAHNLILHIVGQDKYAVYNRALKALNPELPISYFMHQDLVRLSVYYTGAS